MSPATFISPSQTEDAALIAASRNGDRNAFGQIVRRYQGMIAGLIYASVGDVHRSEDLAQETFLSAWKSLSGLREPAKLPAWLCQIARHRILDHARNNTRQKSNFANFLNHPQPTAAPPADAEIISAEENELLWRTLSQMPQAYRETLVLYYRQSQSTADVAAAMETTEAAVRQRLSRGREMLRENLAQLLEKNLSRTAPGEAFTAAVVAALPTIAIKAAMIGTTAKGAAAVKSSSIVAAVSMAIGPIVGLLGGAVGVWAGYRSAQSDRERRFVLQGSGGIIAIVFASISLLYTLGWMSHHYGWSGPAAILTQSAFWLILTTLLIGAIFSLNARQRKIRLQEQSVYPSPPPSKHSVVIGLLGATIGGMAWMLRFSIEAHDHLGMWICIAATIALLAFVWIFGRGKTPREAAWLGPCEVLLIGLFTLIMVNWRFRFWIAATRGISMAQLERQLPLWALNVMVVALILCIEALMIMGQLTSMKLTQNPASPPTAQS